MGLDLALGLFVVLAAIRGWLKGFLLQAIRLAGLVACVYAADPVRDLAKPYVLPSLPSIRPDLVDRLLWWSASAVCYVVLVGLATLVVKLSRRQAFGLAEPHRNDQFAGFLLGAAKGVLVALFLVAGLDRYARERIQGVAWAEEQAKTSKVLKWNAQYEPAAKIWASPPVKSFVNHVQRMGLSQPEGAASSPEVKPLQAASGRAPRLSLPSVIPRGPEAPDIGADLDRVLESIQGEIRSMQRRIGPDRAN
jgi:uncharacterized membrane protein required for colicin V production